MSRLTESYKGKLYKYFKSKLGAWDYKRGWLKSRCPYCGKEAKFGINLSRNLCHCFRCDIKVSPIGLVMYMEGLSEYREAYQVLQNPDYSGYEFKEENYELLERKKEFSMPDGFFLLNQGNSQLAKSARNYVRKRGFDPDELSRRGWGYSTDDKYFGYLIIPYHENGKLVYFNARLFMGSGPRYNNPTTDETGIGKSMVIYNRDALYMYNSVFLCEGAINAQTMGERGIASGGKAISRYQVNEIIKSPVKKVIILYDSDALGKAVQLGLDLAMWKKVKVVVFKDSRDVNDLGRNRVLKMVYSTPYLNYQELLSFKMEHNL